MLLNIILFNQKYQLLMGRLNIKALTYVYISHLWKIKAHSSQFVMVHHVLSEDQFPRG